MTNYFKRGVKGSIIILVATILASFFGYLVRIFLAKTIPLEQFGLFYSVFTFFMFLSVFTRLGYSGALVRFVPYFITKKKKELARSSFFHVFIIEFFLSLIFAFLLFVFADFLALSYFKNPLAKDIIYIFCVLLVLKGINGFISASFRSLQDMKKHGLLRFINKFLFFALILILFYFGFPKNVSLPSYAYLITTLIGIIGFGYSLCKKIKPKIYKFNKKLFFKLSSFALPTTLTSISGFVIGYIDVLILTYFLTLDKVGIYNSVLPTVLIVGHFSGAMITVLFPMVSEIYAKKEFYRLKEAINIIYKYSLVVSLPFALIMLVYPNIILRILFGSSYVPGFFAMQLLALGVIFVSLARINFSILKGIGKPKEVTKIVFLAAIFNTFLNFLLIPIFGIEGAALTTTLSYLIMLTYSYTKTKKVIKFKIPYKTFFKLFVLSIIFISSLTFFKYILKFGNIYIDAFLGFSISLLIYCFLVFKLKIINWKSFKEFLDSYFSRDN